MSNAELHKEATTSPVTGVILRTGVPDYDS